MDVRKIPLRSNRVREAATFRPYPEFPFATPMQLDAWLSTVKVSVLSALEWEWQRRFAIEPRIAGHSICFWFEKGAGTAWFGEPSNVVVFRQGDLLLIPQGVEHAIEIAADEDSHVHACHFHAHLSGIDLLKMLGFPWLVPYRRTSLCKQVCERLVREYAVRAPGWSSVLSSDLHSLLIHVLRTEPGLFKPRAGPGTDPDLPRLLPVLEWIDLHLHCREFTIADLAGHVSLSETHFRRLFQKVLGASPVQFIRERRIQRACSLLRSTDTPIKKISAACGFAEEAFFSRVFHRVAGTSPAAFRTLEML